MFAVVKTGGKQYKVTSGDVLKVEKLAAVAGDTVQFNEILMLGGDKVTLGTPLVAGAAVQAEVMDQIRGKKVIHFVKRRRKHGSQRTKGHRQSLTILRVTDILASGADKSGVMAAVGAGSVSGAALEAAAPAKKPAAKKPAAKKPTAKKPAAAKSAPKKAATTKAAPKKAAAPVEAAAGAKPANLLDAPRGGKADDLKKISGVGPKLETLLNENGVYHFDQIAAWHAEDGAYMDDKLSLRGRFERDDWAGQAKALAEGKE